MAFDEDLDPFFVDFGTGVTVAPQTDAAAVISGIFDNAYFESNEFAGDTPRLQVKSSDVSAHKIKNGTVLEVDGKRYQVAWPPQHDGTGLCDLWMHNA